MNIKSNKNENELIISIEGRLDTVTAPELDDFVAKNTDGISSLVIDCAALEYVSSAGLRVILSAHKRMGGALKITNVCELVMEVFEVTGFADILNIA